MKCLLLTSAIPLVVTASTYAQKDLPPLPETLVAIKAEVRRFPGMIGKAGLSITSKTPLTEEQWAAVAEVPVTSYLFTGNFVNTAGLAQIAKLPVEALILAGCIADGEGAKSFAAMKSLKRLSFSHCTLSAEVADALAGHPALETLTADNPRIGDNIARIATAPKLRQIALGHAAGSDRAAKALENHPTLENVSFWATGSPVLTEKGVASLTTLKALKELALYNTIASYEGSLKALKNLPALTKLTMIGVDLSAADFEKLKADLPKVEIKFEPMTPATRQQWDKQLDYRLKQEARAATRAVR